MFRPGAIRVMINFPGEPGRYDLRSGHLLSAVDPVFFNFLTVSVDWLEGGHLVKRYAIVILALMLLVMPNGCAWLDYQETKLHSGSIYLPVDAEAQNFGYQRLMINCRLRDALNAFIETHGFPDFIYEYNKAAQNGIRLYYLDKNQVYDFLESGSSSNSAKLLDQREPTSFERAYLKELQSRQPL